jgi:hypothetical protein
MKEIKYTILYCACENFCDNILLLGRNRYQLRFRFQLFDKLRFRFHKAKSYGFGSTRLGLGFPSPSLMRRVRESWRLVGLGGSASQLRPVS